MTEQLIQWEPPDFTLPEKDVILQDSDDLHSIAGWLVSKYVPSDTGDIRFKEITIDYGGAGTTCGFLCHWLMWRLGCCERFVNRTDHSKNMRYVPGTNISKIRWMQSFRVYQPGETPKMGDLVFLSNGPPSTEHVNVFLEEGEDDKGTYWLTADAGQKNAANKECARFRARRFLPGGVLDSEEGKPRNPKHVQGWLPLDTLPLVAPVILY